MGSSSLRTASLDVEVGDEQFVQPVLAVASEPLLVRGFFLQRGPSGRLGGPLVFRAVLEHRVGVLARAP
jgi:hypothetical protein